MYRGVVELKNGNRDSPHFKVQFRKVSLLLVCGMEETWEGGNGSKENPASWLLQQTGQQGRSKGKKKP